jgi:erythronate-4-phosphate dehydrogenase
LGYLLEHSDIVTMHVPLDKSTARMADAHFFSKMKPGAIFINASRGEVVDDHALLAVRRDLSALILDVWNGEPGEISRELVDAADIATPHIAGYSLEGKINGTSMVVRAFARHFGIGGLTSFIPECGQVPFIALRAEDGGYLDEGEVARRLLEHFPVYELDAALRSAPEEFEKIRSQYKYRREFRWR